MAYKYPIHRKRFHNVTLLKMDIPKKRWNWFVKHKKILDNTIAVTATAVRVPV
jgi:aspartate-semialdehyde dehydrogenase